jgi:hypothetical protein
VLPSHIFSKPNSFTARKVLPKDSLITLFTVQIATSNSGFAKVQILSALVEILFTLFSKYFSAKKSSDRRGVFSESLESMLAKCQNDKRFRIFKIRLKKNGAFQDVRRILLLLINHGNDFLAFSFLTSEKLTRRCWRGAFDASRSFLRFICRFFIQNLESASNLFSLYAFIAWKQNKYR